MSEQASSTEGCATGGYRSTEPLPNLPALKRQGLGIHVGKRGRSAPQAKEIPEMIHGWCQEIPVVDPAGGLGGVSVGSKDKARA